MMKLKGLACVWAGVLAASAGLACPAVAQSSGPAPAASAAEPEAAPTAEALANALARLAIFDLRATTRPGDADYRIATILLGLAHEQRPENAEILRRQIEAAWGAGDHPKVQELTRALLAIDPGDTVAQLRLITASIANSAQTAEQRLEAYDRFLGPEGKAFSPAIRSRLALDAALLLRERGDTQGFIDRLKLALQLDGTHKEAAALAVAYFAERLPEDRLGRLTLLQNLLMADPVDPNVHLSIARELAGGGAFKGARRFYETAIAITSVLGGRPDESIQQQAAVLHWHDQGPAEVARGIRNQLTQARAEATRVVRRFEGSPTLPEGVTRPEDIRLPMGIASLAIAAADAAGDPEAVEWAYREFSQTLQSALAEAQDPAKRAGVDTRQLDLAVARAVLQMCMTRLFSGVEAELVGPDMEKNKGLREAFPEEAAAIDGWVKLRAGDLAGALETLKPLQDRNLFALMGVALAQEKSGQTGLAIGTYEEVLEQAPLSHYGAWARGRMKSLGWEGGGRDAAALERAAAQIPEWVDRAVMHPRQYLDLSVTSVLQAPGATDAAPLKITLQNLAPIPLALGPDRALNSRILLAPKIETHEAVELPWFRPEIVDIDRRLRLMPREKLEVLVNPELGGAGWAMETLGNRSLRVRWRATQGFVFGEGGGFRPGVMCLTADSPSVVRQPLPEAALGVEGLLRQIGSATPEDLARVGAAVRALIMQPLVMPSEQDYAVLSDPALRAQAEEKRAELLRPLAEALAARYASLPAQERAVLAALVPHAGLAPGMQAFDEAVRAEEHPLPLAVVLATRVTQPTDELLVKAGGAADPRIRQLAFAIAERLGADETLYARLTPERMLRATGIVPPETPR